jgi:hypothetical protein
VRGTRQCKRLGRELQLQLDWPLPERIDAGLRSHERIRGQDAQSVFIGRSQPGSPFGGRSNDQLAQNPRPERGESCAPMVLSRVACWAHRSRPLALCGPASGHDRPGVRGNLRDASSWFVLRVASQPKQASSASIKRPDDSPELGHLRCGSFLLRGRTQVDGSRKRRAIRAAARSASGPQSGPFLCHF